MSKSNRASLVAVVIVSLLGVSSIALAEHSKDHPEDTLVSFGYDVDNHFLAINIEANDTSWVCDFGDDALAAEYGEADEDGKATVDTLKDDEGDDWEFEPRKEGELGDNVDLATDNVAYSGVEGECVVNGVIVAGPNGQINHGQFMKAAKSLFGEGHGCINRYFAQSDIGKGETQLKTSDVDELWEFGENGEIEFTSFEADCKRGKGKDKSEDAKAGKARGKSADAPGKSKNK
jgi:hypothetical protein